MFTTACLCLLYAFCLESRQSWQIIWNRNYYLGLYETKPKVIFDDESEYKEAKESTPECLYDIPEETSGNYPL